MHNIRSTADEQLRLVFYAEPKQKIDEKEL